MEKINIVLAVALFLVLLMSLNAIRKHKLDLQYSLTWLFCLALLFVIDVFPGGLNWLAQLLGIELPINMIFLFGIGFCLILIFGLTTAVSQHSEKEKRLNQEIALLQKRVEELERKQDESKDFCDSSNL